MRRSATRCFQECGAKRSFANYGFKMFQSKTVSKLQRLSLCLPNAPCATKLLHVLEGWILVAPFTADSYCAKLWPEEGVAKCFTGGICRTRCEAELSAAKNFWKDGRKQKRCRLLAGRFRWSLLWALAGVKPWALFQMRALRWMCLGIE